MGLPIVTAQHSGPLDTPGEQAYLWARSGIARSATTRSNYVSVQTTISWIGRDPNGGIQFEYDITSDVLVHTLHVTQAINDEPDTANFTLKPKNWSDMGTPPTVGQEIRIAWAPGGSPGVVTFHGFIVTTQSDWQLNNLQPPWIAVQCQDPMWRFDARLVTYRFPAQSVTASIQWLVKYFCNAPAAHPLDFTLGFVQANMPSIPAFDVTNQRPSTVMRTLLAAVNGGFYIAGLDVHAWPDSISEPYQSNPTQLTVGLKTLHTIRKLDDATQLRRRVLVEGRRTAILIALPQTAYADTNAFGVPLQDATIFPNLGPSYTYLVRVGTQWMYMRHPISVTANGANPPQTKVVVDFTPGQTNLVCAPLPITPPAAGWVRVGNQYSKYDSYTGNPLTENWTLVLPVTTGAPYGFFTANIKVGDTIEWVDCVMGLRPHGIWWNQPEFILLNDPDRAISRAHPTDSAVVTLAYQQTGISGAPDTWPEIEGFVQDGRYSYAGAQARADADLANFREPLASYEWETDDNNATPGRLQEIRLFSNVTVDPGIFEDVTILRVDMTFPLLTLPPRRRCTGGVVKPSTFMDLVVTENM